MGRIDMVEMTEAQKEALRSKWERWGAGRPTWPVFLDSVQPTSFMDCAVVVKWCGMWLVIETDGYTHS